MNKSVSHFHNDSPITALNKNPHQFFGFMYLQSQNTDRKKLLPKH
jgi:hypothetical protein